MGKEKVALPLTFKGENKNGSEVIVTIKEHAQLGGYICRALVQEDDRMRPDPDAYYQTDDLQDAIETAKQMIIYTF